MLLLKHALSGHFHKYAHVRGKAFLAQARRERRAYPSWVCEERATKPAAKRTAARRVAPSSRLAPGQKQRNERERIYESDHLAVRSRNRRDQPLAAVNALIFGTGPTKNGLSFCGMLQPRIRPGLTGQKSPIRQPSDFILPPNNIHCLD